MVELAQVHRMLEAAEHRANRINEVVSDAEDLRENPDVKEFYLGLGELRSYRQVKHYRRRKRWLA